MRVLYRETRYICGDYMDVDIYPVFRRQSGRGKKAKPTSEVQEKLNARNAERKLLRLLHTNFTGGDYEIHLTYRDADLPKSEEEAKKRVDNFMRRVKRRFEKSLPERELRYIIVDEGGAKEGEGRFHHHVTISGGIDRTELEELWGHGYANCRQLQFTEDGVAGLARYITKGKKAAGRRRWRASKNLKQPEKKERDGKISNKTLKEFCADQSLGRKIFERLYEGYYLAKAQGFENGYNGGYYAQLSLYSGDAAFLHKRKGGGIGGKKKEPRKGSL